MARGMKQTPEQIVELLRQIEVQTANGKTSAVACQEAGIAEQTYYDPKSSPCRSDGSSGLGPGVRHRLRLRIRPSGCTPIGAVDRQSETARPSLACR
jgi:hypothetical protein